MIHLLAYFRQQYIHIDVAINLALHGPPEGVCALLKQYHFEFIDNGHVKRVDLNLEKSHLSFHLFNALFGLI